MGRSRREVHWKNIEMPWSQLVEKLSKTHRTAETYDEYIASKRPRQDEIKDIGGFVGGYLSKGRRKPSNVMSRQLITLDIDFATDSTWDDFCMLYNNAACVYSTHKHSPKAPRLRLILPVNRPLFSEEYIAIARRIAGDIDIEAFDNTGFQPSRLMYWPSTASDAEYFFDYQDGPWIDADEILATYQDWTDSSEWPTSIKVDEAIKRGIKKQGDPLEKPGVIGAFCRTHTIPEAIEKYLDDVYEPSAIEDRYTYKEGSTSAGLIVYEDKYAYSHHGTDPVSGKLCNAFDLVRIHLFGIKDEDARDDTPTNKLPSYVAMMDLCTKDKQVRKQIGRERLAEMQEDFTKVQEEEEGEEMAVNESGDIVKKKKEETADDDWLEKLDIDKKGKYLSTINNVALILENDPKLKGKFRTDQFKNLKMVVGSLPWRRIKEWSILKDQDEQNLNKYLEKYYEITNRANIKDAFDVHLDQNGFHPVKDYLDGLYWDGLERLDTLLVDYLGCQDSAYMRAVTRKSFVAAVARIYEPGIKFDHVLTIIGPQGLGKSYLIDKMGKQWFSDSFNFEMLHKKEAYEQLQGYWLIEIGELTGLKKADVEAAKQFLSKREDAYRPAYGRNPILCKRQCVFFGSTNNRDFLRDPTGNRRFWPAETMIVKPQYDVFKDLTEDEIDQIWAEAVEYYRDGEKLYLSKELEDVASEKQDEHTEMDGRLSTVARYLEMLLPENWDDMSLFERRAFIAGDELQAEGTVERDRVCVPEIWCEALRGDIKDLTIIKAKEIHNMMKSFDQWKEHRNKIRFNKYGILRGYLRKDDWQQT